MQGRSNVALVALVAAVGGISGAGAHGANSSATPSAVPAGVTPRFLGFNNGHFRSTSNTAAWVDYSGVNAMRVWAAASEYTSTNEGPTYGDGITSSAQLDSARAAVRASPESNPYVNIGSINWSKTQTGRNHINLDYVLGQLQQRGVDVLLQSTRSTAYNYFGAGADGNIWGGRWEQWKWYYTLAYWAGRNHDVQRYQMYNEPDHSSSGVSGDMNQWVDRLKVASDAIHAAIADVNAGYGKSLSVEIYAPVSAGTTNTLDTWGKTALNSNRTDFQGNPSPHDIFNVYDVHRYNATGPTFAADQVLFDQKIPAYNASGQNLPVSYSEFNRHNTSAFAGSADSLETPRVYAEYAALLAGAMSQDVRAMYAFKFNQTYWTYTDPNPDRMEPMKTGFYYVDDAAGAPTSSTHHTTGSTKGAEVMRLADKALKGERPRYAVATGNALNDAAGSFDADAQRYYYYSVNRDTAAANVTLNLSNWNIAPGQVITVEEVSASHHGQVSRTLTVPASGTLTFSQTAQSLFLLTIPSGPAQAAAELVPTADAFVSNGAPNANFGLLSTGLVGRDAGGNNDEATYLKFSLSGTSQAHVSRALLRVTGQNIGGSAATILHVYGFLNDAWTETGITWANAPNLAGAADARMGNVGSDAFPLGALTFDDVSSEYAVDVTDFVRRHPDASLSFVLLREQRFAGDADSSRIEVRTREAEAGRPRLSLSLYARPVYNWRLNGDGSLSAGGNLDVGSSPNSPGAVLNLGAFITSPHTVTVAVPTTLGTINFNNLNGYHLAGAGTVMLDNEGAAPGINVYRGSHRISAALAFAAPAGLMMGQGAVLDVGSNALRLDPSLVSPATLRGYLFSGQLLSSTAGGDPDQLRALGYVLVSGGALVVETVWLGDANLDGRVDGDDYALIDRGLAVGGAFWWEGDFNYDGVVNQLDYLLIDRTYLLTSGAGAGWMAMREAQFGRAYVAELMAGVPEPSVGLGLVAAALAGLRRRRC